MLKSALKKKLHDQRLKLDFGLELAQLAFDLIRFNQCQHLGEARGVGSHGEVALELLLFFPFAHRVFIGGRRFHLVSLTGKFCIPFQNFSFLLKCCIGLDQSCAGVLRPPGAVHGIGQGIAKPGVDFKTRCGGQKPERLINGFIVHPGRRKFVEDRAKDIAVLLVLHTGFLCGVQVFFKARFKDALVGDVPAQPVPRENFAGGIQNGDVFSQKRGLPLSC